MKEIKEVIHRAVEACISCGQELTRREIMYSNGCCPYCGYIEVGTVVATNKRAVTYIYTYKSIFHKWFGIIKTTLDNHGKDK